MVVLGLVVRLWMGGLLMISAVSAIDLFGFLVPKDGGVAVVRDVAYGPHERHRLDIYRQRDATGPQPVMVFIYGGAWDSGDRRAYDFVGRAFAARGLVTVIADYRLVPEGRYPGFLEDNAAALAWVAREIPAYGGLPDRLFIAGHSAGAYNAAMLGLDRRFLDAAGADAVAPLGVIGLSGPYDFLPLDVASTIAAFGHVEGLEATQPIHHARADAPPMLLIHGTGDDTVYPRNSIALASAMTEAGGSAELMLLEGEDHAATLITLSRLLRGTQPVYDAVMDFVADRLAAADAPRPDR